MAKSSNKLDKRCVDYIKDRMPMIGVGTYQVQSESILRETIDEAFKIGYRFIDTAQIYRNEETLGRILPGLLDKHFLSREDIFITSKVSPTNQGKTKTIKSVLKSLQDLKTSYIDLVLIHWPGTSKLKSNHKDNAILRAETYAALEGLLEEGKIRSIGVSNYEICHLQQLLSQCRYIPGVNQCECHPHFPNKELSEWCKDNDIHFQAYSSLGGPGYVKDLLADKKIKEIADAHDTTSAVILLAWGLTKGYSVLPRTEKVDRISQNWKCLKIKLSEDELNGIDSIDTSHKACWDPTVVV